MDIEKLKVTLKSRVAKGLNYGIEAVEEVLDPAGKLYDEFIAIQSKYNDLMYVSGMNMLPYEQIAVGQDRLRSVLLTFISGLDERSLKKEEVTTGIKDSALPTGRGNFFQLVDIHFRNLDAIKYVEVFGGVESVQTGREALFSWYQTHRRKFRNDKQIHSPDGIQIVRDYFVDYFQHEKGTIEIYFKNIKHLMAYVLESELEQAFFLNTLRSLFSRYELGFIFYFALSGVEPDFKELVEQTQLMAETVRDVLILPAHFDEIFWPVLLH